MTIHLRGLPNDWDEWRPSKLNLYEGDGDGQGGQGGQGGGEQGQGGFGGEDSYGGPGAGFGDGFGDGGGFGLGEGGFGLGDQTGEQGQQGGGVSGFDNTGVGSPGGPEGLGGGYQGGFDNTGVGSPGGPAGFDTGYQGGYDNTGIGSPGGPAGFDSFGSGPGFDTGYQGGFDNTGVGSPGGPAGFDTGYQGGFDNTGIGSPGGPAGFADPFGMPGLNENPDISARSGFNVNENTTLIDEMGRAVTVNPSLVTNATELSERDGQINSALAPGERGPSSPFTAQELEASPFTTVIDPVNPLTQINDLLAAPERGPINTINPHDLPTLDDPMNTITGFPAFQTTAPAVAPPDARGALSPETLDDLMSAIARGVDPIGPAHGAPAGKDQSQFGAQGKDQTQFGELVGPPAPAAPAAPAVNVDPEDPGAKGLISVDPEAPVGREMTAPHNQPGLAEFWGEPVGRDISPFAITNPFADEPEQAPHSQPGLAEFWGEPVGRDNPYAITNPFADEPEQAPHNQPGIAEFWGEPTGRDNPYAITNPFADEPEQAPHNQPGIAEFWGEPVGRDNPYAITNPFADEPTTPEEINQIGRDMLAEQISKGVTMDAPHNQPSLDDLLTHMLDIQSKGEQGRDPAMSAYDLPGLERGHVNPLDVERGQDLDLMEQEDRALVDPGRHVNPLDLERSQDLDLLEQEDRALANPGRHVNPLDPVTTRDVPAPPPSPPATQRGAQERGAPSRGAERGAPASRGLAALGRGPDRGVTAPNNLGLPAGLRGNPVAEALTSRGFNPDLVGVALTINDRGAMLIGMLEAIGLSHAQAVATANAARGAVEAQHGLPSNRR